MFRISSGVNKNHDNYSNTGGSGSLVSTSLIEVQHTNWPWSINQSLFYLFIYFFIFLHNVAHHVFYGSLEVEWVEYQMWIN